MIQVFEQQLAAIVSEYDAALARSASSDASDILTHTEVVDLRTRCISAIERASGRKSVYYMNITELRKKRNTGWFCLSQEMGVVRALLSDMRNGHLQSFEEVLHGNVFGDYLEMAMHLLDKEYKDAAAVLAGSTLEVHIRNLCAKHSISTSRDGKTRKTEELNAELAKHGVYTKLDQKNVTAWLGLRNDAAHGNYSAYTKDQVSLFLQSIRDFITRHPA